MNADISLTSIKRKLSGIGPKVSKHISFAAILFILLIYIFTVWRVSRLATAEPSSTDTAAAQETVPKVDQKAINQVLKLENNSPQVHSLFNDARNNPFGE